jgi:hypothetical protein
MPRLWVPLPLSTWGHCCTPWSYVHCRWTRRVELRTRDTIVRWRLSWQRRADRVENDSVC